MVGQSEERNRDTLLASPIADRDDGLDRLLAELLHRPHDGGSPFFPGPRCSEHCDDAATERNFIHRLGDRLDPANELESTLLVWADELLYAGSHA
jgi:hypothetical protein